MSAGLSHHAGSDEIKSALSRCLPQHGIHVACCLGSIELDDSAKLQENLLRVELAEVLLRKVNLPQGKDDQTSLSIKAMVDAWQDCEVEDIRMRGIRAGKLLKM